TVIAATRQHSWDHYAFIQKENVAAWDKYKAQGVQVLRLSEADIQKFRRYAIPMWFKWANRDPLAREPFPSQLPYTKRFTAGSTTASRRVDIDAKTRLTL